MVALGACSSVATPGPPTDQAIAALEEQRVLEPIASETKIKRQLIVEFAPTVETRGVSCIPDGGAFACSYESRLKEFLGSWEPWKTRTMRVAWNTRDGEWRAAGE